MRFTRNKSELRDASPVKIAGLTGGIASGKTVATEALRSAGYTVIDADEVSRALTAPGTPTEKRLAGLFPEAASNGALDRRKLRAIISVDTAKKRALEEYLHPLIKEQILKLVSRTPPPVILSAPLLFESALSAVCDCTVCLVCPRRVRISRLTARDSISDADAINITDAQLPDAVRASLARYCVPSDTDRDTFTAEIVELFDAIFSVK